MRDRPRLCTERHDKSATNLSAQPPAGMRHFVVSGYRGILLLVVRPDVSEAAVAVPDVLPARCPAQCIDYRAQLVETVGQHAIADPANGRAGPAIAEVGKRLWLLIIADGPVNRRATVAIRHELARLGWIDREAVLFCIGEDVGNRARLADFEIARFDVGTKASKRRRRVPELRNGFPVGHIVRIVAVLFRRLAEGGVHAQPVLPGQPFGFHVACAPSRIVAEVFGGGKRIALPCHLLAEVFASNRNGSDRTAPRHADRLTDRRRLASDRLQRGAERIAADRHRLALAVPSLLFQLRRIDTPQSQVAPGIEIERVAIASADQAIHAKRR